jgi:Zn-dependent M28 family amino/carboxypeptidase
MNRFTPRLLHLLVISLLAGTLGPTRCALAAPPPGEAGDSLLHAWGGIHGAAIAEHVRVLASDEFEGRAPGTRGEERTLEYLRTAFRSAGLEPWRPEGYEQEVPLVEAKIAGAPRVTMRLRGKPFAPALREGYVPRLGHPAERVDLRKSKLVFAGHGAVAPEYGWDDYAGADLRGATVVLLYGDPGTGSGDSTLFDGISGTRHAVPSAKYEEAAKRGARAAIVVHTEKTTGFPWTVYSGGGLGQGQHFLDPERSKPELDAVIVISEETARALFQAAGRDFDREARAAATTGFRARPLDGTIDISFESTLRRIRSHNMIGLVPGSEAPGEALVLMAHWDHMGRDTTREGDQIFNGAVDNATGVSMLIEIARAFRAMPRAPRRTVAFVATTAEERGLLGSEHLARHPIRPLRDTVGAVAIDAHFPYGAWERMAVTGFGNTELEEPLARAAARLGRTLQDDGAPQLGAFYRADNYPFVKRGVPGFLAVGNPDNARAETDPDVAKLYEYGRTRYHQPGDEYDSATWRMEGIEGDARILFEFAWRVADDRRVPNWRWSSPFRALGDERSKK